MRVRLVRPVLVEIAQLDTVATKAKGGYDSDFGAVRVAQRAGNRVSKASYKDPRLLRGQIEDQTANALRMFGAGNSPEHKLAVTFSFHDLEEEGLIDESGAPLLNVNDQMLGAYAPDGDRSRRVYVVRPPGLFAVEVRPAAIGLDGAPGIVIVRFNDRAVSEAPG